MQSQCFRRGVSVSTKILLFSYMSSIGKFAVVRQLLKQIYLYERISLKQKSQLLIRLYFMEYFKRIVWLIIKCIHQYPRIQSWDTKTSSSWLNQQSLLEVASLNQTITQILRLLFIFKKMFIIVLDTLGNGILLGDNILQVYLAHLVQTLMCNSAVMHDW